ncbi:MAG: T9SS sorting signal type C domain-containing protein [Proteiniphilum sp.]|uniref:T9SS sorting signal type C domain-containing protein n=1 Tax=Proteiniphilum sp. TaxID=1926877 RepID=UPI002B211D20|nr:T9SS sorting signal type C domain-containing protein [Proteiniphilum sp.]MEA5126870.1 T9SS sorting signal type C domain-containing protein [Proteiniphilum sp.]
MKFENTRSIGCRNSRKQVFYRVLFMGFLAVLSFSLYAQDSDNTEFWFVAPDASNKHDDRPTFLMITTGEKAAEVTISMPANSTFPTETKTINPYSYWKYEFSTTAQMELVENSYKSSGTVTQKGILITSSTPVSAYYQIDGSKNNQKEIFTLKGKKALGINFYMPFQDKYKVSSTYNEDAFRQIQIVATQNNTNVTITATGDLAIGETTSKVNAGSAVTRTLNKGETLLWRGHLRDTKLTGSHITSNYPIAVTLFEDCLQGSAGSIDPIGDQLVPTTNLGKNYIVVKGYSNGNNTVTDNVVIVAVENGTVVNVDGKQETLNAGQFWSYDLGAGKTGTQAYYVNADKPVYCLHQSAADTEIGGALLPSLYSISGRRITFIQNDSLPISSMFLVFRSSAKDGFTLDSKTLSVDAKSAGFDDWMYAKVDLKTISGTDMVCTVANPEGSFALGYFNGSSTGTSLYGYLSAFGTFSFGTDTINHCGDKYQFDAPYALSYDWKYKGQQISTDSRFVATNSGFYTLTVDQDPYTITDEVYLKLQNFSHILSAPEQLLENKSYNFTIKLNPEDDPDNYFRTTYLWNFGEGASIPTSTKPEENISFTTPGTKTIELTIWNHDANCDTTIIRTITVLDKSEGKVLYWKTDTKDRDWNNVNNWAKDPGGNHPIAVVPADYTKVYLPGKAANYPSLTEENTDWTHYGQPESDEIVFRYGSELHYQHKLKYNKAYIDYNWGYYDKDGTDANGQPSHSWENGEILKRNIWHALAAPLKRMASGDFSLGGNPFSWQNMFEVNVAGGIVQEGGFPQGLATNDIPLEENNNAIAAKMAGYESGKVGHENQTNLEGLKGVIEIPYFGSDSLKAHYTAHSYDALAKKSFFYYFDTRTLKLLNSPIGSMGRAGEAYRFVYETDQNEPPASGTYEMPLNTGDMGTTLEVMVGNPFLAPVNARAFAGANTGEIVFEEGFKLLSEDGLTWEQKSFESDTIPAWKAFIVTLSGSGVSSLSFPLEATIPLRTTMASTTTRASYNTGSTDNALSVHILKAGVESGDRAILQNNRFTNNTGIRKMILPEGHQAPEIFFISSGGDLSYLVRNLEQGENEVAIGVKTSDTRSPLTLQFKNVHAFTASTGAKAILVDKHLNVRQDLTINPVYRFMQQASGIDKQYVDKNRFVLQLGGESGTIGQEDPEDGIKIVYHSGILKVTSDENIDAISVYDLYGRLAFSIHSVNLSQYTRPVDLQGKQLFLVRVKTTSGKEKVKKIMGN